MAYQFSRKDKSVQGGVRRIAREEIAAALDALAEVSHPLPERVHEARKTVKKLRGLIRLVRPTFEAYAAENAALREAGRQLSGLRESEVARQTLFSLADAAAVPQAEAAGIGAPLLSRHAEEHAEPSIEESLASFRAQMKALDARAARWRVDGQGFDAIEEGVGRSARQAKAAMKRALRTGRDEAFHDWRKRAKDHWYQARLLVPIWPEAMEPHVAAADRLGEALGAFNDLSVLIVELAPGDQGEAARARLLDEAAARRAALLDEAALLGRRLFAGPPEALAQRWRVWWEVWRG
jgi:CHAD domain-containing protein